MYTFFNTPECSSVILREIDYCDFEPKVKSLKRLCDTRWVQHYDDAVNDFVGLFQFVVVALEIIYDRNNISGTDASILLKAFDSEFQISLYVIKNLFSYGLPLSIQLQSEQIDLMEAVCLTENTVLALKDKRTNTDDELKQIFLKFEQLATIFNTKSIC